MYLVQHTNWHSSEQVFSPYLTSHLSVAPDTERDHFHHRLPSRYLSLPFIANALGIGHRPVSFMHDFVRLYQTATERNGNPMHVSAPGRLLCNKITVADMHAAQYCLTRSSLMRRSNIHIGNQFLCFLFLCVFISVVCVFVVSLCVFVFFLFCFLLFVFGFFLCGFVVSVSLRLFRLV